jgi:hypothetical protein
MNNELHKSFDRSSPFPFRQYMHDIENVVYVENLRKAILNGATEQDLLKSMRKARKIRKAQLMQPAPSGETAAPAEVSTPYSSRQGQAERSFDPDKGITAGSLSAPDPDSTTFGVDGGDVRVSNKQVRQMLGRNNIDNLSDADRQQVLQEMNKQPQAKNPAPSQDLSASMPKNPMQKSGPFPYRDYRTDAGTIAKGRVEEDPDQELSQEAIHREPSYWRTSSTTTDRRSDPVLGEKRREKSGKRREGAKEIADQLAIRRARRESDALSASMSENSMQKSGPFPFRSYRADAGNGDELMKSRAIKNALFRDNDPR